MFFNKPNRFDNQFSGVAQAIDAATVKFQGVVWKVNKAVQPGAQVQVMGRQGLTLIVS